MQPRDLAAFATGASHNTADYKINVAVPLLFESLFVSLVAVAVILLLPPLVLGTKLPREKNVLAFLLYFLFIGAGYILIEVALIQKFVLFLGHPTYALTVVIFSMLLSSGLGSFFSRTLLRKDDRRLLGVLVSVAVLVSALATVISVALESEVGLPLEVKIAITILLIFPAGFAMGMPFPTGLERLEAWHSPSTRWAWSLNAASACWVGRRFDLRHLSGPGTDAAGGRHAVSMRVSGSGARPVAHSKVGRAGWSLKSSLQPGWSG